MTVILSLDEIKKCIGLDKQLIPIIEEAFKNLAQDKVSMPPILRLDIEEYHGESDVKAAYIQGLDSYAIKVASGFFNNPKIGLPSSNGLMILLDSKTGVIKSILLDKGYLTDIRTAIAGAIAAKYLSNSLDTSVGLGYISRKFDNVSHFEGSLFYDLTRATMSEDPNATEKSLAETVLRSVQASNFIVY